jgi:hypothetical protein
LRAQVRGSISFSAWIRVAAPKQGSQEIVASGLPPGLPTGSTLA